MRDREAPLRFICNGRKCAGRLCGAGLAAGCQERRRECLSWTILSAVQLLYFLSQHADIEAVPALGTAPRASRLGRAYGWRAEAGPEMGSSDHHPS